MLLTLQSTLDMSTRLLGVTVLLALVRQFDERPCEQVHLRSGNSHDRYVVCMAYNTYLRSSTVCLLNISRKACKLICRVCQGYGLG